jgi:large subunit ribosomal protein L17
MRHQRSGKKMGRDSAHRKALYANLAGALIEHGRIRTTVTKAKAVKPIAEQMITLGRRGDLHARRQAVAFLRSKDVVHKLFSEIGPRFSERPGGYTRIIKLGPRAGDAAEMVYLELVDTPLVFKKKLSDVAAEIDAGEDAVAAAEPEAEDAEPEAEADTEADGTEAEADDAEPEAEAGTEPEAEVAVDDDALAAEAAPPAEPEAAAEPEAVADPEPVADAEPVVDAAAEVEGDGSDDTAGKNA